MSKNTNRNKKSVEGNALPEAYTSKIVKQFLQLLDKCSAQPQILDIGPVCSENIMFLGSRVKKLYVCDFYYRLHLNRRERLTKEQLWQSLYYAENLFDGILLWDMSDRMDRAEFQQLAAFCLKCLKPGGFLFLTAYGKQTLLPNVSTFVLGQDYQISFRPQPHLELSMVHRHNREILDMLTPLSLVKAQINRNGFREFLLQMTPE